MRPLRQVNSALKDLRALPDEVRSRFGRALYSVQRGHTPEMAKPLKGIGSGVFELVLPYQGSAFRAVYVVRLRNAVYLLHVFQKKSKSGIATPKPDIALIRERLKYAEEIDLLG